VRSALTLLLIMGPHLAALGWSAYPSLFAIAAVVTSPVVISKKGDWNDESQSLQLRRKLQKHFLKHYTYIPLDDITTDTHLAFHDPISLAAIQKVCGRGRLYIWIPLKINLPLKGEKVFEWCWKPDVKII
jgi:hypothetical protein